MEENKISAEYVVSKFKNKKTTNKFLVYVKKRCRENQDFDKEMSKIKFVWVGKA